MEDILDKYTMGEFLEWLEKEPLDKYIIPKAEVVDNGETVVVSMADIEALKTSFMEKVHRYEIFIRGNRIYIHDNKTCQDVISWIFTEANKEEVQDTAENICKNLNNGVLHFVSCEKSCW